ncbi:MAG: XRE family transcriptional regulator [Proteobacteria bacterium]|nr:XRE family transcriptional regulator [Pseudomonadota bacterium]
MRLRIQREELGLSAKDVARAAGISAPFLSRVENGITMPSVPTLYRLAEALSIDIASIFEEPENRNFTISRKNDRRKVYSFRGVNRRACYQMEVLSENMPDALMEPALVTALVRDLDDLELARHSGQEFCMVVQGRVEIILGAQRFRLEEGDSAYWDGRIPHGAVSLSETPAKTLNVHIIPGQRSGSFQNHGVFPEALDESGDAE